MEWWCLGVFMWWYSFLYYETMRLWDLETLDLETIDLETLDFESLDFESLDPKTARQEKTITIRCLLSDVFKSFRLLVS